MGDVGGLGGRGSIWFWEVGAKTGCPLIFRQCPTSASVAGKDSEVPGSSDRPVRQGHPVDQCGKDSWHFIPTVPDRCYPVNGGLHPVDDGGGMYLLL